MVEKKKDVIVLGGGPAGSFSAMQLVAMRPELTERIVLLEAKRQGRDKVCAGGVSGRVMRRSREQLGIDIASLPGRDIDGLNPRFMDMEAKATKKGFGKVIRRDVLDSFLLDRARDAGVTVFTETPATRIQRTSDGVSVETKEGTFTGKVLIAADGVNGLTKRTLGLDSIGRKEFLYMARLPELDMPPRLIVDYSPILDGVPGYAWFFPEEKGLNAGITGGSPGNMKLLKSVFFKMVQKNLGADIKGEEPTMQVWPERFFSVSVPSYSERILFVGDNLGVTPLTGEGIGVCFDSSRAAAQEALRALDRNDYSFRMYPWRLKTCEFFPTWSLEHIFLELKSPMLFRLFFMLTTERNKPIEKTLMDLYCRIFAGDIHISYLTALHLMCTMTPSWKLLKSLVLGDKSERYS